MKPLVAQLQDRSGALPNRAIQMLPVRLNQPPPYSYTGTHTDGSILFIFISISIIFPFQSYSTLATIQTTITKKKKTTYQEQIMKSRIAPGNPYNLVNG